MRTLLILFFSVLSSSAIANSLPIVEDVSSFTFITPDCDVCPGGTETTTTTFTFTDYWCAANPDVETNYELVIEQRAAGLVQLDSEIFVRIKKNESVVNCMGSTRAHTFEISTEELKKGERYILANPTVISTN